MTTTKKPADKGGALLSILSLGLDAMRADIAEAVMPDFAPPTVTKGKALASPETFARLYSDMLSGYLHEGGHEAAILTLNPAASPRVRMNVAPLLNAEGVGVEILGGTCSMREALADPHEQVVVCVAGFFAETVGAAVAATNRGVENPVAEIFGRVTVPVLMGLWLHESFVETFPGCETDCEAVREAGVAWIKQDGATDDTTDDDLRKHATNVGTRLEAAFAAALRIATGQADAIFARAVERTNRHFARIMEQLPMMAEAVDHMRMATFGVYTDDDADELEAWLAEGKPATEWKK